MGYIVNADNVNYEAWWMEQIDGLVQDCSISNALALEMP